MNDWDVLFMVLLFGLIMFFIDYIIHRFGGDE